jgi:tryptophan synthase alpha chain
MNRIDAIFADLRRQGRKALMPFVIAGDPDLETTGDLLVAMEQAGASICELGFPFSDPIADGPVIQASMHHALTHGVRPAKILDMVARQRSRLKMGLLAMVSYSVVYRLGTKAFIRDCAAAGIDGFILPDLPVEESDEAREAIASAGLSCAFLISPTSTGERAQAIARACSGFVYVLARAGITGERNALPADLMDRLSQLRAVTPLPLAVGFGISSSEHVRQVVASADAAIVGTALVRRLAAHRAAEGPLSPDRRAAAVADAAGFVRELCAGLGA